MNETKIKFDIIPQNNAKLRKNQKEEFTKIYSELVNYTYDNYLSKNSEDKHFLAEIIDYLWEHMEIFDEYIKKNKDLTEKEITAIKDFKTGIRSDEFILVGYQREYTEILGPDNIIYMVKGVKNNIDRSIKVKPPHNLNTTLLMFDGVIICDAVIGINERNYTEEEEKEIFKKYSKAKRKYTL